MTQGYSLLVNPVLSITLSLPQGTAGTSYNQIATVTGGSTLYASISISNFSSTGSTGLTFQRVTTNVLNGTVSVNGSPTGAGTITFTVNVIDAAGAMLHQDLHDHIQFRGHAVAVIAHAAQRHVRHGLHRDDHGLGRHGTKTLSVNLISNSAGLTIPGSGTGSITINGTPFQGTASFTVTATDAAGTRSLRGFTRSTINPALSFSQSSPLNPTTANFLYTNTINLTGGTAPYTAPLDQRLQFGWDRLHRRATSRPPPPARATVSISGTPTHGRAR